MERTGVVFFFFFFTSLLLCVQVISLSSNPTGEETEAHGAPRNVLKVTNSVGDGA